VVSEISDLLATKERRGTQGRSLPRCSSRRRRPARFSHGQCSPTPLALQSLLCSPLPRFSPPSCMQSRHRAIAPCCAQFLTIWCVFRVHFLVLLSCTVDRVGIGRLLLSIHALLVSRFQLCCFCLWMRFGAHSLLKRLLGFVSSRDLFVVWLLRKVFFCFFFIRATGVGFGHSM
jgi:hypothetical protein